MLFWLRRSHHGADVSPGRRRKSAAGTVSRPDPHDAAEWPGVPADLAPVRIPATGRRTSLALHAGDDAGRCADPARDARADRRLHVVRERVPILTELPRRGRGGAAAG